MCWAGGCGLATCQVITIRDMRQQDADRTGLTESMEYLAVWQVQQDGEPPIKGVRSHPVDAFSTGDNSGRMHRASGQVMHDGAAAPWDADREAVTQSIERCRQADRFMCPRAAWAPRRRPLTCRRAS
jgi:hypothetical protein